MSNVAFEPKADRSDNGGQLLFGCDYVFMLSTFRVSALSSHDAFVRSLDVNCRDLSLRPPKRREFLDEHSLNT